MTSLKQLSSSKCHGGHLQKFSHSSESTGTEMKFSIFLPSSSNDNKLPVLYFLSGLTCTEDNFVQKSCALKRANDLQLIIVAPDTSPRGLNLPDENNSWDFGSGASFYVDATREPWLKHYRMHSYVAKELPALIEKNFPCSEKRSIFGHSMGGHGALSIFLKHPHYFVSVSAFAPIARPSHCPWGKKAFGGYLQLKDEWAEYDSTELVKKAKLGRPVEILIDQGTADEFYVKKQLLPEDFAEAAKQNSNVKVNLRMQDGYDHSYYFIQTFINDHLKHHANALNHTASL